MGYPERLLPQPNYCPIQFVEFQSESYFLLRHTQTPELTDSEGKLKADYVAFQSDHLGDYSTNLLGVFAPEDIKWQFVPDSHYLRLWRSEDGPVEVPTLGEEVIEVDNRGCFYLQVSVLIKAEIDVTTSTGVERVTCKILHTAVRGNFWHCSLRWYVNDIDAQTLTKGPRSRILKAARSFIINNALLVEPSYQAIPPQAYSSTATNA